jgi:hypothetical protein
MIEKVSKWRMSGGPRSGLEPAKRVDQERASPPCPVRASDVRGPLRHTPNLGPMPGLGRGCLPAPVVHRAGQDLASSNLPSRRSPLFHCYDIVGLPATNSDHESLYGQTKRHLRRPRGVSELCDPLLRRGAWAILQVDVGSPAGLRECLAQVSREDHAAERARYERCQEQLRRRYRWRHRRNAQLRQRVVRGLQRRRGLLPPHVIRSLMSTTRLFWRRLTTCRHSLL